MIPRPWFWLGLILAMLWAPVVMINVLIDPPANLVTKHGTPDHSRRQR